MIYTPKAHHGEKLIGQKNGCFGQPLVRGQEKHIENRKRRFLDALVLTYLNLANSKLSVKNKATGTPLVRCMQIYASLMMYSLVYHVVSEYYCIYTSRGANPRCSFRQIGQCESLSKWNERQELAPRFLYGMRTKTTYRSWSRAGQKREWYVSS